MDWLDFKINEPPKDSIFLVCLQGQLIGLCVYNIKRDCFTDYYNEQDITSIILFWMDLPKLPNYNIVLKDFVSEIEAILKIKEKLLIDFNKSEDFIKNVYVHIIYNGYKTYRIILKDGNDFYVKIKQKIEKNEDLIEDLEEL